MTHFFKIKDVAFILPTIFELSLLFEQRSRIGGFDSGDLGSCNYWSSTENGGVFAPPFTYDQNH